MEILVTAGNTQVAIDRVRCLTNIFTGRTGAQIALEARRRGHAVRLLTSHPEVVQQFSEPDQPFADGWTVERYISFQDLEAFLAFHLNRQPPDVVIHSAAVSDYLAGGIFAPATATTFALDCLVWEGAPPTLVDMAAGKVKSDAPELWLRLVRAPKLIDRMRTDWGFRGGLVKFKLEVGVSEEELLQIAERSRRHSDADLMVANTLEGAREWAYLGPLQDGYQRLARDELPARLLDAVERLPAERQHG
jgi:phosphopantothenoylcysteine synthetase/decarboxylase